MISFYFLNKNLNVYHDITKIQNFEKIFKKNIGKESVINYNYYLFIFNLPNY